MFQATPRWFPMKSHPDRLAMEEGLTQFTINHSGRRSYKTEWGKRRVVECWADDIANPGPYGPRRYAVAAPTLPQTVRIYWDDLLALTPKALIKDVSVVFRRVTSISGSIYELHGMDKPERIEGVGWDGVVLDEYGNMKPEAWFSHVFPALSDRAGWAYLLGVPEGRNHYYDLHKDFGLNPAFPNWSTWGWHSDTVLDPEQIAIAKAAYDPILYQQEYGGEFVSWSGNAYYAYDQDTHLKDGKYDPDKELVLCFDFNVAPGVAAVCQETSDGTHVIDEVWIPRGSNTQKICKELMVRYGDHPTGVACYGDPTGASKGSAKLSGSDWTIIKNELSIYFGNRLRLRVKASPPPERNRVNAMNTRLATASGDVNMHIDPLCKHVLKDLDGVGVQADGQLDKKSAAELTHISDAIGYYLDYCFPIARVSHRPTGQVSLAGAAINRKPY